MIRSIRILAVPLLLVAALAHTQEYSGPNILGPVRIDIDVSMKAVFERLGRPTSVAGDTFCYMSHDGKGFLTVTRMVAVYDSEVVGTITLSSFRNCVNHRIRATKDELAQWKTERGVGLSSTLDDVRTAYGPPSKEDRIEGNKYRWVIHGDRVNDKIAKIPELGDTVLVYQGGAKDLRITEFGICNGKVVWISMSKNE